MFNQINFRESLFGSLNRRKSLLVSATYNATSGVDDVATAASDLPQDVIQHRTATNGLTVTIGHKQPYIKLFIFESSEDREEFCDLLHAVNMCGPKAYRIFSDIDLNCNGCLDAPELARTISAADDNAESTLQSVMQTVGMTFAEFLLIWYKLSSSKSLATVVTPSDLHSSDKFASIYKTLHHAPHTKSVSYCSSSAISRTILDVDNAKEAAVVLLGKLTAAGHRSAATGQNTLSLPSSSDRDSVGSRPPSMCPPPPPSVVKIFPANGAVNIIETDDDIMQRPAASSVYSKPAVGHRLSAASQTTTASFGLPTAEAIPASIELFEGETVIVKQEQVSRILTEINSSSRGTLYITTYRIAYLDYRYSVSVGDWTPGQAITTTLASGPLSASIVVDHCIEATSVFSSATASFAVSNGLAYKPLAERTQDTSCELPLCLISRINKSPSDIISIVSKDFRALGFAFDANPSWIEGLHQMLQGLAFHKDQTRTFAFNHSLTIAPTQPNGWSLYDPFDEFHRIGIVKHHPWLRISTCNITFSVSPTYPRYIVVPRAFSDEEVVLVAKYRSNARLPAVVWLHPKTGATLARCSQPLVGIKGARCASDERLLSLMRTSNPTNSSVLYIMDARPFKAAVGNAVMGKGYENTSYYDRCNLMFLNIENIHAIRSALEQLHVQLRAETVFTAAGVVSTAESNSATSQLPTPSQRPAPVSAFAAPLATAQAAAGFSLSSMVSFIGQMASSRLGGHIQGDSKHTLASAAKTSSSSMPVASRSERRDSDDEAVLASFVMPTASDTLGMAEGGQGVASGVPTSASLLLASLSVSASDETLQARIESTQWLAHIRYLLTGALRIVQMLDVEGASVVTHCSDGWDRTSQLTSLAQLLLDPYYRTLTGFAILIEKEWCYFGHKFAERCGHAEDGVNDQRAPIFTQFLDSVYQIIRQFPLSFEFNEHYLLAIAHHLYTCAFGTFLFETEEQRATASLMRKTPSLWSWLLADIRRQLYVNPLYRFNPHKLLPNCTAKRVVLWEALHCQSDAYSAPQESLPEASIALKEEHDLIVKALTRCGLVFCPVSKSIISLVSAVGGSGSGGSSGGSIVAAVSGLPMAFRSTLSPSPADSPPSSSPRTSAVINTIVPFFSSGVELTTPPEVMTVPPPPPRRTAISIVLTAPTTAAPLKSSAVSLSSGPLPPPPPPNPPIRHSRRISQDTLDIPDSRPKIAAEAEAAVQGRCPTSVPITPILQQTASVDVSSLLDPYDARRFKKFGTSPFSAPPLSASFNFPRRSAVMVSSNSNVANVPPPTAQLITRSVVTPPRQPLLATSALLRATDIATDSSTPVHVPTSPISSQAPLPQLTIPRSTFAAMLPSTTASVTSIPNTTASSMAAIAIATTTRSAFPWPATAGAACAPLATAPAPPARTLVQNVLRNVKNVSVAQLQLGSATLRVTPTVSTVTAAPSSLSFSASALLKPTVASTVSRATSGENGNRFDSENGQTTSFGMGSMVSPRAALSGVFSQSLGPVGARSFASTTPASGINTNNRLNTTEFPTGTTAILSIGATSAMLPGSLKQRSKAFSSASDTPFTK